MKRKKLIAISLIVTALAVIACRAFAEILVTKIVETQGSFALRISTGLEITPSTIEWGVIELDVDTTKGVSVIVENTGDVPYVLAYSLVPESVTPGWFREGVHFSVRFGLDGEKIYPGIPLGSYIDVTLYANAIKTYVIENFIKKGLACDGTFGFDVAIHGTTA